MSLMDPFPDDQVKGNKRLKRNQPLDGRATISFGSGDDGIRLGICLLPSQLGGLRQVAGTFEMGTLEGPAKIEFTNGTQLVGCMTQGHLTGLYRQFDKDNSLVGIFNAQWVPFEFFRLSPAPCELVPWGHLKIYRTESNLNVPGIHGFYFENVVIKRGL